MKTTTIMLTMWVCALTLTLNAQENDKDYLFSYQGKNKTNYVGAYAALYGNGTQMMDETAFWLGYRVGLVFNNRFAIGAAGYGLGFDKEFTALAAEGDYRLEAAYAGTFIEYMIPLGEKFSANLSLVSAAGMAQYKMNKDYTEDLQWYEEIIDRANYGVFEPGLELTWKFAQHWALGAFGTYRHTAPITLEDTDEDIFKTANFGISLKYGVF